MKMTRILALAGFGLASVTKLQAQATVGQELPETIGFTQAPRSAPLQNLSEFDYNDLEGQVALVVYHASW